jgi:hypothetical protein
MGDIVAVPQMPKSRHARFSDMLSLDFALPTTVAHQLPSSDHPIDWLPAIVRPTDQYQFILFC